MFPQPVGTFLFHPFSRGGMSARGVIWDFGRFRHDDDDGREKRRSNYFESGLRWDSERRRGFKSVSTYL